MISVRQYNEAIHEYTQNVFRFLMKSLKDEQATEDLLQDCFLRLWENRHKVDKQKIKSWPYVVPIDPNNF